MPKYSLHYLPIISGLILFLAFTQIALAKNAEERNINATQVAKAWFIHLVRGESTVATSLSTIPFSFDRKQEVNSFVDLKKLYDQIVTEKGKRELKPTSTKIKSSSQQNVEVVLMIEDEEVVVSVVLGEVFRVAGFSD